jgi:hypothetical protein
MTPVPDAALDVKADAMTPIGDAALEGAALGDVVLDDAAAEGAGTLDRAAADGAAADGAGTLVIACGALAREIEALRRANRWSALDVRCLSPELHNRPERIPGAVRALIRASRDRYRAIFVAYGDCGTAGRLDEVLRAEGVERIPGAHCYEFFATPAVFAGLCEAEPGTFYLTDFLLRHFDRLVIGGLGLDRHPELFAQYFGSYRRLVYLVQAPAPDAVERARAVAVRMGLAFETRETGYGALATSVAAAVQGAAMQGAAMTRVAGASVWRR